MSNSIEQKITDRIIEAIESGKTTSWVKGWQGGLKVPKNFVSKKPYKGINFFMCAFFAPESEWFLTFKQAKSFIYEKVGEKWSRVTTPEKIKIALSEIKKGNPNYKQGSVMKGAKGLPILFFSPIYQKLVGEKWVTLKSPEDINIAKLELKNNNKHYRVLFYQKSSTVFKQQDIENVEFPTPEKLTEGLSEAKRLENCEATITALQELKGLNFANDGGAEAYYIPSKDSVHMPKFSIFKNPKMYYNTAFHECIHWTGHESRKDRFKKTGMAFGSKSYSKEELVAELGAAILCAKHGISDEDLLNNSAAYMKGWLKPLKADPKFIVEQAKHAYEAVEYIME